MLQRVGLERWLVLSFGLLLCLSFIAAVLVLGLGFPLKLSADEIAARGQISQALSTVFALVLGFIAILVALHVESASYKAGQEVRNWLGRLTSTLFALMRHSTFDAAGNIEESIRKDFQNILRELHSSQTSLAMTSWIGSIENDIKRNTRPKGWRVLMLDLCQLEREKSAALLGRKSAEMLDVLSTLRPFDIGEIASRVRNLDDTLGTIPEVLKGDLVLRVLQQKAHERSSADDIGEIFRYIKSRGVNDPDLDLFIAVTSKFDDVDEVRKAVAAGANPHVTDGEILQRYRDIVVAYRQSNRDV